MGEDDYIYRPQSNDPYRSLSAGSVLCVSYTSLASLKQDATNSASATLGNILVDWRPAKLELPDEIFTSKYSSDVHKSHGPLALDTPSTVRFTGPIGHIERAPFKVKALDLPPHVTLAAPFDIKYAVANTTSSHQSVSIQIVEETESDDALSGGTSGLMLSGFMKGQITLGPLETRTLSYRAIAFRTGEVNLPQLRISSDRYRSWIINEVLERKQLFVIP
jgi:hypothetical protein